MLDFSLARITVSVIATRHNGEGCDQVSAGRSVDNLVLSIVRNPLNQLLSFREWRSEGSEAYVCKEFAKTQQVILEIYDVHHSTFKCCSSTVLSASLRYMSGCRNLGRIVTWLLSITATVHLSIIDEFWPH